MSLIIDERLHGGWLVLSVVGDLDIYTAPQLRSELMAALDTARAQGRGIAPHPAEPPQLDVKPLHGSVVDLSGVSFMDSAGLGVLVGVYKRATADRTPLRLAGVTEQVSRLFAITGLSKVFPVYSSVADASQESG